MHQMKEIEKLNTKSAEDESIKKLLNSFPENWLLKKKFLNPLQMEINSL